MQKILIVVDMQNDFVTGALGTREAAAIVPFVAERVEEGVRRGEKIFFTRDTHQQDYPNTQEGKKLPVPHCIQGTDGWEIVDRLKEYTADSPLIDKPAFGSTALGEQLRSANETEPIEKITLIGLCTDICVISNALLLKAYLPETAISVDASCCAGVTPASHKNALDAMSACQIEIENF